MSEGYETTKTKLALSVTLALILTTLAPVLLLASLDLAITRGETRIDPESHQQFADQLNMARNIALVFFFVMEAGASWLLVKYGPVLLPRLHWLIRLLSLFVILVFCSYILVIVSLTGRAPDLVFILERSLSGWLMGIAK